MFFYYIYISTTVTTKFENYVYDIIKMRFILYILNIPPVIYPFKWNNV